MRPHHGTSALLVIADHLIATEFDGVSGGLRSLLRPALVPQARGTCRPRGLVARGFGVTDGHQFQQGQSRRRAVRLGVRPGSGDVRTHRRAELHQAVVQDRHGCPVDGALDHAKVVHRLDRCLQLVRADPAELQRARPVLFCPAHELGVPAPSVLLGQRDEPPSAVAPRRRSGCRVDERDQPVGLRLVGSRSLTNSLRIVAGRTAAAITDSARLS